MKTTVVAFENRTDNRGLITERKVIELLNRSAVYVDDLFVLSESDSEGFASCLDRAGEVVVIVNIQLVGFDWKKVLSDKSVTLDKDGFFIGKRLIAVYDDKPDYAEKLTKTLSKFFGFEVGKMTFKLFGETVDAVKRAVDGISDSCPEVFFNVTAHALDVKVDMFYSEKSSKMQVDNAVKQLVTAFKNRIYAEDDVSLEQRLYDLLKLHRLKCSTAESMTGGAIAARIVSVEGASDVFYEGMVTYDTLAKERRLCVLHKTIIAHTVVSSEVAYEMAKGLSENADVAISITGYAGSSVHPDKDDGLCFIGIGLKDKTEVYRFKFEGSREENIACATSAALYLAIKTIQNNDF